MHYTHTQDAEAQLVRDVTCLPKSFYFPQGALNNISACSCSPSILSHPVFSHDPFMNTSSCKASFSTWGYFCSIMHGGRIKTVDAMAFPPDSVSRAHTRRPMAWQCGAQQGAPLGHPHISGSGEYV